MVPVHYMIRAALRWDTAMSRAMLRACGIPVPRIRPRAGLVAVSSDNGDVIACFVNHGSPMDGRW